MRLLIIEDNADAARALCKLLSLRISTLECCIAGTLKEGLKLSKSLNADITLLDLMLPGSEVEDVIEAIPHFTPPVIVVTDVDDSDHKIMMSCFAHKAQSFVSKAVLRSVIDSIEYEVEADNLVQKIIDAHFRNVLPKQLATA